jgi:hypothetical protein
VVEQLRIASDATLWVSHADRVDLIGPLPRDVHVVDRAAEAAAGVVFADDAASLREILAGQDDGLRQLRLLWVAYPKGNRSDINRDSLWPILAERGMRPIGQVALDDTWSAIRFRRLQPGETFDGGAKA